MNEHDVDWHVHMLLNKSLNIYFRYFGLITFLSRLLFQVSLVLIFEIGLTVHLKINENNFKHYNSEVLILTNLPDCDVNGMCILRKTKLMKESVSKLTYPTLLHLKCCGIHNKWHSMYSIHKQ